MSINEKNLTNVYVANAADKVQVINNAGTVQTALVTDNDAMLRIKQTLPSGVIKYSPFFKFGEMFGKAKQDATALVEQISYLGYNSSTGALDATADSYFGVKISLDHQFGIGNNSPLMKTIPYYSTTASQEDLAYGLMESAITQFKRDAQRCIKFDRVSDATLTELVADTTVIYGATSVASAGHGLSAGDYVSLQGATYAVASVTTDAFELDIAYQGDSETILVASTVSLAASAASISNWGIRFVGITPVSSFNPVSDSPYVVRFTVQSPGFTTASVTDSVAPTMGSGTYQQVSELEAYSQFMSRDKVVESYPPTVRVINADSDKSYDILNFSAVDKVYSSVTTGQNPLSVFGFVLAFDSSLANDYDDVDVVLGIS